MQMEQKRTCEVKRLMLLVLLLLTCMVLVVGTTWARYYADKTGALTYTSRDYGTVSLWSVAYDEDGALVPGVGSPTWVYSNGTGTLEFCVSNGTATDYAEEDLEVSIRLMSTLSVTDAQVAIYVTEGTQTVTYSGTEVQIQKGTPLYEVFGGGYAYVFLDKTGKELSWTLKGGDLSSLSAQIDVMNLEQKEDTALLQLQVAGK